MVAVRVRKFQKCLTIQEIQEILKYKKYFKTYLRKIWVTFCEHKKLRKLAFPTVPFELHYGINWDGITMGKESEGLLGREWIQVKIYEVSAKYPTGCREQEFWKLIWNLQRETWDKVIKLHGTGIYMEMNTMKNFNEKAAFLLIAEIERETMGLSKHQLLP